MRDQILDLMNQKNYRAMVPRQIMSAIGSDDLTEVMKTLNQLDTEHLIIHDEGGHYALLSYFNVYLGRVDKKDSGFGFVLVPELEEDIFISKRDMSNALDKDLVYVQVFKNTNKGLEGQIIEIVERNIVDIIGVLKKRANNYYLQITGKYHYLSITIPPKHLNHSEINDVVKVIITDFNDGFNLKGKVSKIIGTKNQPGIDITMMVEGTKISTNFSKECLNEAINLNHEINFEGRVDKTDEMIVTIDGDDAKDFDDAISVKKIGDNHYQLGVYIADVSEYVKVNSNIDIDASIRTSSCYLPDRVIPMLPFELSNDLCSLRPNENRYALACVMEIKDGEVIDSDIFKAVIKSKARLTYNNVNKMLEDNNLPTELMFLKDAADLAAIIGNKRHQKGSLDFETKEAKIVLDDYGTAIDVVPIKRGISEKMIEEFMIICNETVTERITYLDLPFVYRVHDEPKPEKIKTLIDIAKTLNITIPKKQNTIHPLFLQTILEKPETEEAKTIFNHLILRSMAKAKYSINNIGHFGLASKYYTHFTSPIRRYPDLMVHRLIKDYLLGESNYQDFDLEDYLNDLCEACSDQEKVIESLERDVDDMKKAEYMLSQIGSEYEGMVSGIQRWGVYVQLPNSCEGLIGHEELYSLGYQYIEEKDVWSKNNTDRLTIGKYIKVRVINASKARGTVDFEIVKGEKNEKDHHTK